MTVAWVGLGSNVRREVSILRGVALLRERFGVVAVSPTYESSAAGVGGEPFLNLVVGIESDLAPEELRDRLKDVEVACGRPRDHDSWAPRTLDADLLLLGDLVRDEPRIPDPDVLAAPWVLVPLADVAPEVLHPEAGRTIAALLADRPGWREGLVRRDDLVARRTDPE